jgi:nucleoside-diphosphate-sugar epimerase
VVDAHLLALDKAPDIGFDRLIVTATTPFTLADLAALHGSAPSVVAGLFPHQPAVYGRRGWRMFDEIDRVYVNDRARSVLGWRPAYDFARVLSSVAAGEDFRSPLAAEVGAKGYHPVSTGPYTVR